ncbi:hypothetical protein MUS1_08680 [Marinomonas ushuaiensis DSM 15871]|uniref:Uncharacterized protein n=2 Tax=Marinomonas TaxID=28253 RepID=X7E0X6_9GAMM|nr:hypothetical protein MUS1_08680 [Marinomonas ushuaiensis DSM 15871]
MFRELTPKEAFQNHCLAQMGVTSWLSAPEGVSGTIFMPSQPWGLKAEISVATVVNDEVSLASVGFGAAVPEPVVKMLPEEKEQSVNYLREQLNAGPEIIVEDLQPIEELAVDIVVEPDPAIKSRVTRLDIRAYALSNKLLILSDVPQVFSQEEEVERLALKMGQALLKQSIDEWQGSAFSWPGALKNQHFLMRTDWLFGAVESYISRLVKSFTEPPMLVLAGNHISQLVDDLPAESPLKTYPTARIVSLSELHRIPELRKEAWEIMQSSFFDVNTH